MALSNWLSQIPSEKNVVKIALALTLAIVICGTPMLFTSKAAAQREKASFQEQKLYLDGEEIRIIRDAYGIPHILSATPRAAYYAGGYAVAQDRLYQLERFRRDARGELAEIESSQAFYRDAQTRRLGYTEEELQAAFNTLPDSIKQTYQSYSDGINLYIKEAALHNKIPAKFSEAGINRPAPWRVTDSIAIGIMMGNRFGSIGGVELLNIAILEKLRQKFGGQAEQIFNDLFWINDPRAPTSIVGDRRPSHPHKRKDQNSSSIKNPDYSSLAQAHRLAQQYEVRDYAERNNLPTGWGSICWVISPKLSASGKAILVGNPQMGYATPQIAHEIHYSAGELNVIGMGFPGIPGVIVGHNNHIAWSMTRGLSDMKDIFAERLHPKNKDEYFYKGAYRKMERRTEIIKVKGEQPRSVEVYRTVHGPVVGWNSQSIEGATLAYSLAATYSGHELTTFRAIHGFNYAKTMSEFASLAETIYTNHNFLAASDTGDIGYWHCGRLPLRAPGQDPRLPVPGTGEYEWRGFLPFSKMPQVINPDQGFIINWNNKPAQWWDNGDSPVWGEAQDMRTIEKLIMKQAPMSFEQARDMAQKAAAHDGDAEALKPYLLMAIDRVGLANLGKRIQEAANYLRAWDNYVVDGSVAKTIFDAWLEEARQSIFADEFDSLRPLGLYNPPLRYSGLISVNLILHVLQGSDSGVRPSRDYLNGKSRDEVLIASLEKALTNLASKRGAQMNLWAFNQGWINLSPLPGIPETNRGTYIHAVELSKPLFRTISILPPGQSEDPLSPHYNDQRELAGYWRFKDMIYTREQLEGVLASEKKSNN